jgi:hypothetical protein
MYRQIVMELSNKKLPENPFGDFELCTSCVQSSKGDDFNTDSARMREELNMTSSTSDYRGRHGADSLFQ